MRSILRYLTALSLLGAPLAVLSSCTAKQAAQMGAALAPLACNLIPVLAPDAKVAAVLCDDIAPVLERLLLAQASASPTMLPVRSNGVHACRDGLPMVALGMPGRDPAERVCAEHLADVRRALEVGHAK